MRMLIFEYAANGSLHEHLHGERGKIPECSLSLNVKNVFFMRDGVWAGEGFDHLDWEMRMRIIMGIAYCLEHMHDLSPPFVHPCLRSSTVFLTDDYASKVIQNSFLILFLFISLTSFNLSIAFYLYLYLYPYFCHYCINI